MNNPLLSPILIHKYDNADEYGKKDEATNDSNNDKHDRLVILEIFDVYPCSVGVAVDETDAHCSSTILQISCVFVFVVEVIGAYVVHQPC